MSKKKRLSSDVDLFSLDRLKRRMAFLSKILDAPDEEEVTSRRGATKSPFDEKYRKRRKIRMRMQKQSRRINRARR
jgi:hypothetical protein